MAVLYDGEILLQLSAEGLCMLEGLNCGSAYHREKAGDPKSYLSYSNLIINLKINLWRRYTLFF